MSDTKAYIGIDPGRAGCLSVIFGSTVEKHLFEEMDTYMLTDLFYDITARFPNRIAVIEDVKAIHGASSTTTFSFGMEKGKLLALLCATRTPFHLVTPQKWQKGVWATSDMAYISPKKPEDKKKVNTKATSINCAKRLFPTVDLRKSDRCHNPHDGIADSLLMAEYARRNNL